MPTQKLTKRTIDAADYEGTGNSRFVIWDELVPGLGLRVYPSGTKSFVLSYRNEHGRKRMMTLGRYGVLTLTQARSKARKKLVEVDEGEDPLKDKQTASATDIDELVELYIEKYAKVRRESTWQEDERRLEKHVTDRWSGRPPESLEPSDVAELHREIGANAKVEANRVIATIQTMFNFAQNEGIVDDGVNPAAKVDKFSEGSRERWMREHEIKTFRKVVEQKDNIHFRNCYWLILLTGTRRNEMLQTRWEHVDLERAELYIPETKNGSDHTVPLSTAAVDFFKELPREDDNPYVFPSPRLENDHIKNINDAWRDLREDTAIDDVRIHDFRRTCASWIARAGYSQLVIKKILNHSVRGPTGIYARLDPKAVRNALEEYGQDIMAASRKDDDDVEELSEARKGETG